ncbi:MAG: hypothetical protein IJ573_03430 [Clostridia bacterium]|nr:hypothetical protein [Clostridia bacterium]
MKGLFAAAAAEETARITAAMEGMTANEAVVVGALFGLGAGFIIVLGLVWFILSAIADWKIFAKAGRPGWKALVPILREYEEFGLCWNGSIGMFYAIMMIALQIFDSYPKETLSAAGSVLVAALGVVLIVVSIKEALRLAEAFGRSRRFGVGLFLLGPVMRLVLGFGSAQYAGRPE